MVSKLEGLLPVMLGGSYMDSYGTYDLGPPTAESRCAI